MIQYQYDSYRQLQKLSLAIDLYHIMILVKRTSKEINSFQAVDPTYLTTKKGFKFDTHAAGSGTISGTSDAFPTSYTPVESSI